MVVCCCCNRAGVVPGQIAAKARQYQKEKLAQEKRAMGGGAVRSSTKPPTCLLSAWPLKWCRCVLQAPVLIPVAGSPMDSALIQRWFTAAKRGETVALQTMIERWCAATLLFFPGTS